jgi:hypothetical protein
LARKDHLETNINLARPGNKALQKICIVYKQMTHSNDDSGQRLDRSYRPYGKLIQQFIHYPSTYLFTKGLNSSMNEKQKKSKF